MPKQYNPYIKYSGLAIQMAVTIYLGNLLGEYIDNKTGNENGLYENIITLIAVILSTGLIIRQVIKDNS
ncbi:AtpZ/AtpI family protein [Fulvivirga ligni]|uniref:AtpZ/AtpI family protein n=1 Tax=Fulvivirga ligni TaxID=2904246 RepID=UPI00351E891C